MTSNIGRRSILKLFGTASLAGSAFPVLASKLIDPATGAPSERKLALIRSAMKKHSVPGVSVALIEKGELAWQGAFGVANIETNMPVQNTTLFQAASLTKPVFAFLVLRLIDQGHIGLDDKLIDFFRPDDLVVNDWTAAITVRHVLTHQTGLPNWRPAEDETAKLQSGFEPGTSYSYSGEAFHWLQQVCEMVTGLGLAELAKRHVFEPAGLADMEMLWLPERDDREVYGHVVGEDGKAQLAGLQFAREQGWRLQEVSKRWGRPMISWRSHDLKAAHAVMRPYDHPRLVDRPLWRINRPGSAFIDSASSLRTTASDYARFLMLMMPGQEKRRADISSELKQMMLSIQTDVADGGPNRPVGFSWSLEPVSGGIAFDHWGFNAGQYISMALGDTSNGRGIVIMTNGARGNRFMDEVGPVLTGVDYRSFF